MTYSNTATELDWAYLETSWTALDYTNSEWRREIDEYEYDDHCTEFNLQQVWHIIIAAMCQTNHYYKY